MPQFQSNERKILSESILIRTDTEDGIMVKFLKNIYHMISKRAMYKPVLSFSTVVAFQESELGKPKSSLKLENMREKWSHKYLLQQSR